MSTPGPTVSWGWEFTLQMDLWKARKHRFLADVVLKLQGERFPAHKLLLCVRSLPLAQLVEAAAGSSEVDVTPMLDDVAAGYAAVLGKGSDRRVGEMLQAAFGAVLEFTSTDWLAELGTWETLLVAEMAKLFQMPFLFGLAAARLLESCEREAECGELWPLVVNALWVPDGTDFSRMLCEHRDAADTSAEGRLQMPFDLALPIARRSPSVALSSKYLPHARIEPLCALLCSDFPEAQLSPPHLEHLLLQACLRWIAHQPQHVHVLTLVKLPLLPSGALAAELKWVDANGLFRVSKDLLDEGAKAPAIPLTDELVAVSGGAAQEPGSVLWRLVQRKTAAMGHDSSASDSRLHAAAEKHSARTKASPAAPEHARAAASQQQQQHPRGRTEGASSVGLSHPSHAETAALVDGEYPETVLQNDGKPPAQFHTYVCLSLPLLFSCFEFLFPFHTTFSRAGTDTWSRTTLGSTCPPCCGKLACARRTKRRASAAPAARLCTTTRARTAQQAAVSAAWAPSAPRPAQKTAADEPSRVPVQERRTRRNPESSGGSTLFQNKKNTVPPHPIRLHNTCLDATLLPQSTHKNPIHRTHFLLLCC